MRQAVDPNRLMREAEAHFVADRFADALPLVERVLGIVPGHPAVLHLHGLILSGLGDLARARRSLEAARRGMPHDPQVANNLGNALGELDEQAAALAAYDAAIGLDPGFAPARLNRAITLDQLGRHDEARVELAALARIAAPTAEALIAAASVERNGGDLPAAAARLDEALAIAPSPAAARVRARLALDMGEADAGARHRAALAADPGDRELQLSYLHAAENAEARQDAAARIAATLDADPGWIEGHRALAGAMWEAGERDAYTARYEAAVAASPGNVALWTAHVSTVGAAGAFAAAAEVCMRAEAATGDVGFAVAAFGYRSAAGEVDAAEAILARLPDGTPSPTALAKHRLRRRDPAAAERLLAAATDAAPDDVEAWALRGVAWQALGDPRFHWLNGQDGLVGIHELPFADGEIATIAARLRALHRRSAEPLGQSVRGGTQTGGNLFERRDPEIDALRKAIAAAVERHRAALPPADPAHPLLRHRDRRLALADAWSIRLTGGGAHIQHIHPKGILSAASYWAVPGAAAGGADGRAGWLELGGPPGYLGLDIAPFRCIEPAPGRLVLFPSTLHHGTRPFAAGERISVAFDVAAG